MYINKVIEIVDRLYPNEYGLKEKYEWCDELSAMLVNEYRKEYDRVTLEADSNGDYLLPEGVSFEMIDRIFDGRHMLEKQDFRSEGVIYLSGINRRIALPRRHRAKGDIDVVYLRPHDPIRDIETECEVGFDKNDLSKFYFEYKNLNNLRAMDTINIEIMYLDAAESKNASLSLQDVPILSITEEKVNIGRFSGDKDMYVVSIPEGTIPDDFKDHILINGVQFMDCKIKRIVTDKTVCDAPYDSMYIDFILGKICYYQHDYETYNQHMNLFNTKLRAYQMWLKERDPMGDKGRMENWW